MATEQAVRPRGAVRRPARVETGTVAAEAPREESGTRSLSGEVVGARVSAVEWALYGAFFVIGGIMRLWDLGSRALHHDESLHATYSWYLWERLTGQGNASTLGNLWQRLTTNLGLSTGFPEYHYDPMMHGPYQFHGNALMYLIFGGPSDWAARLNAAFCGTALIALPFFLRRQLGRTSALILSGLLAFSPAFLYYSRFTREDIYFALWTFLFFVGLIRWLDARDAREALRWLVVAAAGFALSWSTKESTAFVIAPIVLGFGIGILAAGYAYQFLAPRRAVARGGGKGAERPPQHPVVAMLGDFARANLPPLVNAFRRTPARAWGYAAAVMAAIILVLYMPIGDPVAWGFVPGAYKVPVTLNYPTTHQATYNIDAFTGGIQYWLQQQHESRGAQPWYYYFLVIPLYEQVAVIFGAAGLVYYFLHRRTMFALGAGAAFLLFTLATLFTGGAPGLQKVMALLMIASGAALFVARPRHILVNLFLFWTVATWGLYTFAGEKMPWLTLHMLLPTMVVAALYAGHLLQAAPRLSRRWLLTAGLLAVAALVSFRSSVALAYADGANPTEMLVYTQTSQDVPAVSKMVHRIPPQAITTGALKRAYVDTADSWPWVWYLHDDGAYHDFSAGNENSTDAAGASIVTAAQQRYPVLMVGSEDHDQYFVGKGHLGALAGYTGYKFKLRWWFPEDGYKAWETTGLGGFLGQAVQPSSWGNLVNWWATRTPFDPTAFKNWSNVYPFYVYVRNDLVKTYVTPYAHDGANWDDAHQRERTAAAGAPAAAPLTSDVAAALTRPVAPSLTINGATLARPMASMRAVAVDAAGNIYATDPLSQRVVKLDRAGRYLTSWGGPGTGPGQFSNQFSVEPAGVAVGQNGHIYVSDWGRIQEFTPAGAFVRQFGTTNAGTTVTATSFFGPRQIAVAPNGNLYIADTGNKRIQVYSPAGAHLFNIPAKAQASTTAPGSFNEPSGVAIDAKGVVYVADYWNKRIQRFKLDGSYLGAYAVNGWGGPNDYNEAYLAVDTKGHLFATDAPALNAHVNHVLELDAATGAVVRAFGGAGTPGAAGTLSQPSGIAVGPDGALYIADAGAVKLLKVQP